MEDCVKNKLPRNKEGLSSKSGKVKRECRKKLVVLFEFVTPDGVKYKNGDNRDLVRVKIQENGGVSCLIKEDGKWRAIIAELKSIEKKFIKIRTIPLPNRNI